MPITVICPSCSAKLKAPDTVAGKTVKCPKCGSPMAVTALGESQPEAVATVFEVREQPAAPQPPRSRRDDDDAVPRPTRKKKKSSKGLVIGLVLGLGGLLMLCVCGGGGLGYYFYRNVANPNVTKANYDLLNDGMSMAEVEAILGSGTTASQSDFREALSHTPGDPRVSSVFDRAFGSRAVYRWRNGDDILFIAFTAAPNAGGKLKYKMFQQKTGPNSYNTDMRGNVN